MAKPKITYVDEFHFNRALPRMNLTLNPELFRLPNNVYGDKLSVLPFMENELYDNITSRAVFNTFSYLYHKFQKGLFVSIIDGKLQAFIPFANPNFKNEWAHMIKVDPSKYRSVQELLNKASTVLGFTGTQKHIPIEQWRANNGMFRYEEKTVEGDTNVAIFRDMFETLCRERQVPDLEVFVNKKDYPLLKSNFTEPYTNIWGSPNTRLQSHRYDKYAPILSGSSDPVASYADIMIPTHEDWARAKYQKFGTTLPNDNKVYPVIVQRVAWKDKKPMAVFRGSSTGAGVTPKTNKRLNAFEIGQSNKNVLDVGFVKWNTRPRKHITSYYLETIERTSYPTVAPMSLQEQTDKYKYILNVEGHVAAYRLSYELSSGSVVLLVESNWKMWYSRYLKPMVHYVPVKPDLSNLVSQIKWCKNNDAECQKIAKNAMDFYTKYLGYDAILDFLQVMAVETSRVINGYAWLPDPFALNMHAETRFLINIPSETQVYNYPLSTGPRCIGRLTAFGKAVRSAIQNKKPFEFVRNLYTSKDLQVNLIKINGTELVVKKGLSFDKKNEHLHETYLGMKTINTLTSRCPHFSYVYAENISKGEVYVEYIGGQTLEKWIASANYSEDKLLSIIVQLCLGLTVGQLYSAFVHYDAVCSNVIIQRSKDPISFDYNIGEEKTMQVTTTVIPIFIDFGKSRAVVHEEDHGCVDRGYVNLFKASRSTDVIQLLNSVVENLNKNGKSVPTVLNDFMMDNSIPPNMKGLEEILEFIDIKDPEITPLDLVVAIGHNDTMLSDTLSNRMLKGYSKVEELTMITGDRQAAISEVVKSLYHSTIPESKNLAVDEIMKTILRPRITELDALVETLTDQKTKSDYASIRERIMNQSSMRRYTSENMIMSFPNIQEGYLAMDEYLTPEEMYSLLPDTVLTKGDWVTILRVCMEASLQNPRLNMFGLLDNQFVMFDYLNVIASHNTLRWLSEIRLTHRTDEY